MALKPKDMKYEEEALKKRIEYVESLKSVLENDGNVVAETVRQYTLLMDDIIEEIALEVHRAVKTGTDTLEDIHDRKAAESNPGKPCDDGIKKLTSPVTKGVQASGGKGSVDMFGNRIQGTAVDLVTCPLCQQRKAAGKFAVHLEKCMGLGRQAGRAATRRINDAVNMLQ